ncbi:MAG: 30S ribosomal protein S12 methylthiotransferase RimO [Planctomycetes bacterium]|nr:30S ribosomal protein S12 methylthiotransferase RimO [Planctomycetota bacterium]
MAKKQRQRKQEARAPRIALVNLGCAKNTVDSEVALGALLGAGFDLAVDAGEADLILINTCGFIEAARQESRSVIDEMLALKGADGWPKVVAMGCLSQRSGSELQKEFPKLDGIFGLSAYSNLADLCGKILAKPLGVCGIAPASGRTIAEGPRLLLTDASYSYLRIADGCDNRCTYCAIPLIRGAMHSRKIDDIVEEAKMLTGEGEVKELDLVAQDTTSYGSDLYGGSRLAELLERLLAETEAMRIRILYAHPAHLDNDVIALLAKEPRLCRYLDLPVQHVDSHILKAMNRHYSREDLENMLAKLRAEIPGLVLRTSLIVGFPGETEAAFEDLLAFVRKGHFQHMGAFGYSPEMDTPAAKMEGMVPDDVIAARLEAINSAQQEIAFNWLDSRIGNIEEVIIDNQADENLWSGRTASEAPEVDPCILIRGEFVAGQVFSACLNLREGYDIWATLSE